MQKLKDDLRQDELTVSNSDATFVFASTNYKNYEIDFDKVRSLEDVVQILRGMRITVSANEAAPFPGFEDLRPYLKERS